MGNFSVKRTDGSVISWGNAVDTSAVSAYLGGSVSSLVPNYYSFAALRSDNKVVVWGNSSSVKFGSDIGSSQYVLENVSAIYGTDPENSAYGGYVAILADGSIRWWGESMDRLNWLPTSLVDGTTAITNVVILDTYILLFRVNGSMIQVGI